MNSVDRLQKKKSCAVDASRNQVEGSGVIYMRPHMRLAQSVRLLLHVKGRRITWNCEFQ